MGTRYTMRVYTRKYALGGGQRRREEVGRVPRAQVFLETRVLSGRDSYSRSPEILRISLHENSRDYGIIPGFKIVCRGSNRAGNFFFGGQKGGGREMSNFIPGGSMIRVVLRSDTSTLALVELDLKSFEI
eukprot:607418-Amorphochlora_amoeboformis.AAC.1